MRYKESLINKELYWCVNELSEDFVLSTEKYQNPNIVQTPNNYQTIKSKQTWFINFFKILLKPIQIKVIPEHLIVFFNELKELLNPCKKKINELDKSRIPLFKSTKFEERINPFIFKEYVNHRSISIKKLAFPTDLFNNQELILTYQLKKLTLKNNNILYVFDYYWEDNNTKMIIENEHFELYHDCTPYLEAIFKDKLLKFLEFEEIQPKKKPLILYYNVKFNDPSIKFYENGVQKSPDLLSKYNNVFNGIYIDPKYLVLSKREISDSKEAKKKYKLLIDLTDIIRILIRDKMNNINEINYDLMSTTDSAAQSFRKFYELYRKESSSTKTKVRDKVKSNKQSDKVNKRFNYISLRATFNKSLSNFIKRILLYKYSYSIKELNIRIKKIKGSISGCFLLISKISKK